METQARNLSKLVYLATALVLLALPLSAAAQDGYWECTKWPWVATTTARSMNGQTSFECGSGICGDSSHTQPTSWVDIWGGISRSCEDHSTSFYGPESGEWDGCLPSGTQTSTGVRAIEGIDQSWDRWPVGWSSGDYSDEDISYFGNTRYMNQPFASIYDLETCITGDIVGTIYWPNFAITATLLGGDPSDPYGVGYAKWDLSGSTAVACSTPQSGCETEVCADLLVASTFECTWMEYPEEECAGNPEIECI